MTWKTKTLEELCKMYQPKTLSKKQLNSQGKYLVYGANGIIGKYHKYNHEESQLLITCRGATCGSVNISEPFSWINGNAMVIQPKKNEISKKYLEYFFKGPIDFSKVITGSAQPQITRESLNPTLVSYPSLPEQQQIVSKLDALFVEINKSIEINNICLKNSIKLKEELINRVIKNIDSKYFKKFQDCCHFVRGPFGGSLTKSMFKDEGFVVYEQQHAIHNQFSKIRYFIDEIKFNEMKRFELKPGDLIMSCSGVTLGKIAIVPDKIEKGIINQALLKITPSQLILKDYLKIIMTSNYFQSILWNVSGGAAQPNVPSVHIIKDFLIPLVSIKEQKKVIEKINFLEELQLDKIYLKKLEQLKFLKQSILKDNLIKNKSKAA